MQYHGVYILMDAGEGTQIKMLERGIGPAKIDVILVTHLHGDHIFGLPGLLETMAMSSRQRPIKLLGPKGLSKFIVQSMKASSHDPPFVAQILEPPKDIWIDRILHIKPFPTCHGEIESYGYRIDGFKEKKEGVTERFSLVYTGDTKPCDQYREHLKHTEMIIHDATFDKTKQIEAWEYGHSTSIDAAKVAKDAGAKVLFLFHQSTRYSKQPRLLEKEAREIFKNTYEAVDHMRFYF
jgi:ribonuclease Z